MFDLNHTAISRFVGSLLKTLNLPCFSNWCFSIPIMVTAGKDSKKMSGSWYWSWRLLPTWLSRRRKTAPENDVPW